MTQQLLSISHQPFDYQRLKDIFKDYRYSRNKISKLLKSGEIVALKSGLYVLSAQFGRSLVSEQVANLLYGPSYVSLDYALSRYGLIPEKVFCVTSVCLGRIKNYDTAIGRFSYQQLKPSYYSLAYIRYSMDNAAYLMATAEKALCDKLYYAPVLADTEALEQHLFEDLRINADALRDFDLNLVSLLAKISGKRNIMLLKEVIR